MRSPSVSVCLTSVSPIFTSTRSEGGVMSSLPGQNGHFPWSTCFVGMRALRSVATIESFSVK